MKKTERVFLRPGEFRISRRGEVVETLVGSCVCVCLYNVKTGLAAMNHFLRDFPGSDSDSNIGRFGSTATEYIIKALMRDDRVGGHYRAQIFGGAEVIEATRGSDNSIGERNIDIARAVLAEYRIRIIREEVGGSRGRRVRFDTAKNEVFCRFAGQIERKNSKKTE